MIITKTIKVEEKKQNVKKFWEEGSCGEELYLKGFGLEDYSQHAVQRYKLEPEIKDLLSGLDLAGKRVLEIGVGLGADHAELAKKGCVLSGVDLTERAINHTKRRLELLGLRSELKNSDAESLPFDDGEFDLVYSWGVIHHSPNTAAAVSEIFRVLKNNGKSKIMIYNKYSLIGLMLWLRYGLFSFKSLDYVYDRYLESPGTKAYSYKQARELFSRFKIESITSPLTHADLLQSDVGQRHRGLVLSLVKNLWPRWFFRLFFPNNGLFLVLHLKKISA